MVKLTIPSDDILGDNYNITDISVSNYNPTIDGTVTLTVTVKDVYGDAVSGESVLVTASAGNFTKYNGSTITGASSYTGTTNSSGQFTLTYTCSEWGLITFSANTTSTQIKVKGWRTKASSNEYTLRRNEEFVHLTISKDSQSISGNWITILDITYSDYRPEKTVYVAGTNSTLYRVNSSGNVAVARLSGSATTTYAHLEILWKLKE